MSTVNDPDWTRDEVEAMEPVLQQLSDFYHGTVAVRKNIKAYLPEFEAEKPKTYARRSTAAVAPGALRRTVNGSVGRIFAVAPTMDPRGYAPIADEWQDIDGRGTHGDVWLSQAATWAILDGFYLVLVDAPTAPGPVVPLSEARKYRPRWVGYRREQVINWRTEIRDGKDVLTMLALEECAEVPDGPWAMKEEERVRVLRDEGGVITAEVWAERDVMGEGEKWQLIEGPIRYDGPSSIPVAILAADKMPRWFDVAPPLLPLADKVVEFFRCQSNLAHYEERASFPQPVVKGQILGNGGKLVLGPSSVVNVEAGGDFKFEELTGSSMEVLRANQQDRRQEIGALGLSFLVTETRSAETAKAKALDSAAENASLADAARGIEDGANVALALHASYAGVASADAPAISLNKNLSGDVIDAALLRVLLDMRTAGELSRLEFRQILSRGKIIPAEMATEEAAAQAELDAAMHAAMLPDQNGQGVAA